MLSAAAIVAMLAGCSGAGQQGLAVPGQTQSQQAVPSRGVPAAISAADVRPPAADLLGGAGQDVTRVAGGLYVGQINPLFVNEYALPDKKNGPPKCKDSLSGKFAFYGIGVNAQHELYVPVNDGHTILTFAPNCGAAGPTLSDPNGQPVDVAFDNTNGTVYVADSSTGGIDVYENGATSPTRTLYNPQCPNGTCGSVNTGVAVDSFGNVFEANYNIVEYPRGHQKGSKVLPLNGLGGTPIPTGLELDLKGNLLVMDNNSILIYTPPFKGYPKNMIPVNTGAYYGKLDAANSNLYVSEDGQHGGVVSVFAYPLGKYEYSISNGQTAVYGVAVDPPAPN
ncbi:MAG: hypothetical protein GIW99_05855 [Candidatus Eremiobacteraeota bacterium]|nr:hypothetical protein [Candidatus Eremiobacteraeota bacterium]